MKYLIENWDGLNKEMGCKYIMVFLDYDGTLTPIAESPKKAVIPKETKELIEKLSKIKQCKLAVISGRALADIKSMVGLSGIIYSGNHGLEIEGPKIKFKDQVFPDIKVIIRQIYKLLDIKLSIIKGLIIEDKGLTISVHYRLVKPADVGLIKKVISEIAKPYLAKGKIKINFGKKVIEIKPNVKWDKGKVVLWLLARQQFILGDRKIFPIYIGDDSTDEDAFKALKNKGLTIFVGKPRKSCAQFYLRDTDEVVKLLKQILYLRKDAVCRNQ